MPPGLISSAASGKKAAPKAPARRRPAPTGPPPSAQSTPVPGPLVGATLHTHTRAPSENAYGKESTPQPEPALNSASFKHADSEPVVVADEQQSIVQAPSEPIQPSAEPIRPDTVQLNEIASEQAGQELRAQEKAVETQQAQPELPEQQTSERARDNESSSTLEQSATAPTTRAKRTRLDAPDAPARARPAKRAKRSSLRSNATVQASIQTEKPADVSRVTTSVSTDSTPATAGEGAHGTADIQPTKRRKPPSRKGPSTTRRSRTSQAQNVATIINPDDDSETARVPEIPEEEPEPEETVPQKTKRRKRRKSQSARTSADGEQEQQREEEEEEDLESHQIDPDTLRMYDLSRDSRHGKISEREKAMAEINWNEILQKRREAADAMATTDEQASTADVVQSVEGPDGAAVDARLGATGESRPIDISANVVASNNLEFQLDADGNIVENQETLSIDRGAAAQAAATSGAPVEDINDLTVHLTRATWINNNKRDPVDRVPLWKWKSDPWSEEETDRFYEALRMFGTDFFIISKMFPPKTRRMIKSKFNREEKSDLARINAALSGKSTRPMNLEHYSRETGRDISVFMKYEGIEHAQSVINESMKERQDAMTTAAQHEAALAVERAAEKVERQKREKREKTKSRKKGKKVRGAGTMGGGPDEVTADD